MLNAIPSVAKKFLSNCSGNMAVMFSLAIIPLFAAVGAAVDYSNVNAARGELQAALDSAVIAGTATLLETSGNKHKALKAAKDAFDGSVLNRKDLFENNIGFKINSKNTGVDGTGSARLSTTFMKVVGIKSMPVINGASAAAEIAAGGGGLDLEVALMLDITGSMCANGTGPCTSGSKFSAAKTATSNLVDAVIWADQTVNTSKMSIVPFNGFVRVGPNGGGGAVMKSLTNLDPTWTGYYKSCIAGGSSGGASGEASGGWVCNTYSTVLVTNTKIQPCVTDRYYESSNDFNYTDDTPGSNKWLIGRSGERYPLSADSSDTPPVSGSGISAADPTTNINYEQNGECWGSAAANEMMPLSNNKSAIKSRVNQLEAFGSTGGALGTAMAWFSISPNFSGIWPSSSTPKSYSLLTDSPSSPKKLRKIAILLSDGGFNTYRGWMDPSKIAKISQAARDTCAAMKAKGIEIFTVAYELDQLTSAEAAAATSTMQACGTDIQHFYNSLNATQLTTAFNDIAAQLGGATTVRLIK